MALGLPYSFHTQLRKLRVSLLTRKIKMEMPSDFPKFTWIEIWRSQDSNLSFFYANLQLFLLTPCCLQLSRDVCLKINVHTHQLENLSKCRIRYSRCEEGPDSAFLTGSWVLPPLLLCTPHLEQPKCRTSLGLD